MSRIAASRTLSNLQKVQRVQKRCSSGGHYVTDFKPPTMSDLPVPKGSWQDGYSKKQTKYNIQLAVGVVFFSGTVAYAVNSGLIDLNMPPPMKNK